MSRTNLTATERRAYQRQLHELTTRLSGGVGQLETEALRLSGESQDDRAVRESEDDVARTLLVSEEQILSEATAALARLTAGTFGTCERCGRDITKSRLDALPYARTCARCAREMTESQS